MSPHELSTRLSETRLPAAARTFCELLARLDTGTLHFTAPDGSVTHFHGVHPGPVADLSLKDWQVAGTLLRTADIGLAECYRDGRLETRDLTSLLLFCAVNEQAFAKYFHARPLAAAWLWLKHQWRMNTRRQARRNIQAHYDLSNDFYALWLDPTMTYSSGLFAVGANAANVDHLAAAQSAKYERILTTLAPQPGARILEIGCGWGGFAEYAARTRGLCVTGITLSQAQLDFARPRITRAGLDALVDLQLIDYRDVTGEFDHIVSIEMFEAVGERYWPTYFETLRARLRPGGSAILQAITIDQQVFARYRRGSDFIREYIFPGGMLAPIPHLIRAAERAGLAAGTPFRFGQDYARTLQCWQQRFTHATAEIGALGFDAQFQRLWQCYLSYCEAGFRCGRTDVIQLALTRA